jgi:hypothetical protein
MSSITRVGSATASGTTVAIPSHQAGDLILVFAFRGSSTTAPSVPVGYLPINIESESTAVTCSGVLGYRIADGASDTSGTWTNASVLISAVYRPSSGNTIRIGQSAVNKSTTDTINYPALSPLGDSASGNSWVIGAVGASNLTQTLTTAFTGMTNVTSVAGASYQAALFDTNAGVTSWPSTNQTVTGTAGKSVSIVAELVLAATSDPLSNVYQHVAAAGNSYTAGSVGNNYICPVDQNVGAGNTLIIAFTAENGQSVSSVTGQLNGAFSPVTHISGGAGNLDTWVYIKTNVTAGTEAITVVFSNTVIAASAMVNGLAYNITTLGTTNWVACGAASAALGVGFQYNGTAVTGSGGQCIQATQAMSYVITEICGVAASFTATSGSTFQATAYSTTTAAGSFTPPNNDATGGNFIWLCSFKAEQADGQWTINLFPTSPFSLLSADIGWSGGINPTVSNPQYAFPKIVEGYVQAAHAAINPSFTSIESGSGDHWNTVALALQISAGAGTQQPTGIQIASHQHFSTTTAPSGVATYALQCPSVGNLRWIESDGLSGSNITGVRDSEGNSWSNAAAGSGMWFMANTQPDPNLVVFIDCNNTGNPSVSWRYLDIIGAHASPYDSSVVVADTTGNLATTYTPTNQPSPTTANGLVIASIGLGTGPGLAVTSPAGANWGLVSYTGETDGDKFENADILAHYLNPSGGLESWTFTVTPISGGTVTTGGFICFKAAAGAFPPVPESPWNKLQLGALMVQ